MMKTVFINTVNLGYEEQSDKSDTFPGPTSKEISSLIRENGRYNLVPRSLISEVFSNYLVFAFSDGCQKPTTNR